MKLSELELGNKVEICDCSMTLVDYDGVYFYFKHEWSPAVFKIKADEQNLEV